MIHAVLDALRHSTSAKVQDQNVFASIIEVEWRKWVIFLWMDIFFKFWNHVVRNVDVVIISGWLIDRSNIREAFHQIIEEWNTRIAKNKDVQCFSLVVFEDLVCKNIDSVNNLIVVNQNIVD